MEEEILRLKVIIKNDVTKILINLLLKNNRYISVIRRERYAIF